MRVLVTGSAGYVGGRLVHRLLDSGHEVVTADRCARPRDLAVTHHPCDLRDLNAMRRAVDGVDAVAHVGALSSDGRGSPEEVLAVNVAGTWNVLQACKEAGVGRVVAFSSVNALGNFGGHRPARYLPIADDYPPHPVTPYQLSKLLGEKACASYSDACGMTTICLRPVAVINNRWWARRRMFDAARRAEFGRIDYWAYVDLDDVCEATLLALEVDGVEHECLLLAADDTTVDVPTEDLLAEWYPDTPWQGPDRQAWFAENPYRTVVDCSRAKAVLGWQPRRRWRDYPEDE